MRDSVLKRSLLTVYFSTKEVLSGLQGMAAQPSFQYGHIDYDEYWRQRSLSGIEPRFTIIADHIEIGARVLDVGCGDGAMLEYLAKTRKTKGLGLDVSMVAIEKAKQRGVEARLQSLADLHRQSESSSFDHVVMSEVIEHVADPEQFVLNGWDMCGNTLWLTFPNIAYFQHRMRLLSGKFPVQWVYFPGEHLRFWSIPDFYHWISQLDLPAPVMYPSNGIRLFNLHKLWPNLFGNQIVVRVVKK